MDLSISPWTAGVRVNQLRPGESTAAIRVAHIPHLRLCGRPRRSPGTPAFGSRALRNGVVDGLAKLIPECPVQNSLDC